MKKFLLPLVVASALVLAACTPQGSVKGTQEQKAQKLTEIVSSGGSATCRVTDLANNSTIDLTVSGKKMKLAGSDFGAGKKGTMINDGLYTYVWEDNQVSGFKIKNSTGDEGKRSENQAKQTSGDYDSEKTAATYDDETKFKLDCSTGDVADADFIPPTDVKFVDPSQVQQMTTEELMELFPTEE